jgi:hypothetical protein
VEGISFVVIYFINMTSKVKVNNVKYTLTIYITTKKHYKIPREEITPKVKIINLLVRLP